VSYIPGRPVGPNLQARGGSIQPISFVNIQTADTTGSATFTFDQVALSNTWTVTINCAGAPDTARFTAQTSLTTYGSFKGSNSWGPMQLEGGDQLSISATGLVPGTQYTMNCLGVNETVTDPAIVYPAPYADTVTSSTEQLYLGSGRVLVGTGTSFTVPISTSYRSLYFALIGTNSQPASDVIITCVGSSTSFNYSPISVPYSSGFPNQSIWRIPLLSLGDPSVEINLISSASIPIPFWYGADLADVDTAIYAEGGPIPVTISSGGGSTDVTVINTTADPVPVTITGSATSPVSVYNASGTLFTGSITASTVTFTVTINDTYQAIWTWASSGRQITVTGSTGAIYTSLAYDYLGNNAGYVIPVANLPDTSLTITLYYPSAPTTWSYSYGYSTSPQQVSVSPVNGITFPVSNTTVTPLYIEGVQGGSSNAVLITGQGSVSGSTPIPITNSYASPGLLTIANGQSGGTYQNEVTYGGATSTQLTITSTTATQILAAPITGKSYRIHAVSMYYSGTLSTTPVVGRFLSGGTGPAYATLCFPYFSGLYLGGVLTTTAVYVICSSTTSTTFSIFYDLVATPTIA